jgi:hypothetical protein
VRNIPPKRKKRKEGRRTLARFHSQSLLFTAFSILVLIVYILFQSRRLYSSEPAFHHFKSRFQHTSETLNATMSAGISAIRIPCSGTHKASIIWLHGLGDTGRGWSFIQQFYNLSVFPFFVTTLTYSMSRYRRVQEG